MICSKCGRENPEEASFCGFCSAGLGAQAEEVEQPIATAAPRATPRTSRSAVWSLVLGLLGLFTAGITAILGLVLGIVALRGIRRSDGRLTGDQLAKSGIAASVIIAVFAALVLAIPTPMFIRDRKVADLARSLETIATVNGRKISRQEYFNRLERATAGNLGEPGLTVLRALINEELILLLAEKKKCPATEAQVKERYASIQRQPGLLSWMTYNGFTEEQVRRIVRVEQARFNLSTRGVSVPEKELKAYYEKNKKKKLFDIREYADVALIFCDSKADADKAMALLKKGTDFGKVAEQISSEKGTRDRDGRIDRPIYADDEAIPANIVKAVMATKVGKYTQPLSVGSFRIILKVITHHPRKTQTYEEARYVIWNDKMLEKAKKKWDVDAELKRFHETASIKVMIDRYKGKPTLEKGGAPPITDLLHALR